MEQRILLLFSLYGLLHGQGTELSSVLKCCKDGRIGALAGQDCTVVPLYYSQTCSVAWVQCCLSAQRQRLCDYGIKMALQQGPCETPFFPGPPWDKEISKACCDCCALGLVVASWGLSCDLHALPLGEQCAYTAKTCCGKNTTREPAPAGTTETPEVVTTIPAVDTNNCEESNCSDFCEDNGVCSCYDGFELQSDGVTCEDIDECSTRVQCGDGHTCVNMPGTFDCLCLAGFIARGNRVQKQCEDFNECDFTSRCSSSLVCVNTVGSYHCASEAICDAGYELTNNNNCEDIDECALGTHNCEPTFLCNNTEGSFLCIPNCAVGFMHDTTGNCTDINECLARTSPCPSGQNCHNTVGSFRCLRNTVNCEPGYHITADGMRCEDVDECRTDSVCGGSGCVNMVGTYRCDCQTGFRFSSITGQCEDINECRHYRRLCAHKCENTVGSYKCSCATGFKLAYDGILCEDINECENNPCSQECANVYGSYHCSCQHGYKLSDFDGRTCEDIDECALPAGSRPCAYSCFNTPGSFHCTCPSNGYTLTYDGYTCEDIDECAAGTHSCSVLESCFNVHGGFRCLSFKCPPTFQQAASRSTADVTVRCVKTCQPHDLDCLHNPIHLITYSALSLPTFRDVHEPLEIVLLRTTAAAVTVETDVYLDILAADDQFSFDVVKQSYYGMIIGVIRLVKPIIGPKDFIVEVAMTYLKSGVFSHRNIVKIQVFIAEF